MSDVKATNCGCLDNDLGSGNNWIWIIILIALFFCFCGGFGNSFGGGGYNR